MIVFCPPGQCQRIRAIESYAKKKEKWLRKYLDLPYGIPTDDTCRIVIGNINTDHLFQLTVPFLQQTVERILDTGGAGGAGDDGKERAGSIWTDKVSYKRSMKRIRYELSLNYEGGVEKILSMLDAGSIRKVWFQKPFISLS